MILALSNFIVLNSYIKAKVFNLKGFRFKGFFLLYFLEFLKNIFWKPFFCEIINTHYVSNTGL